MDAIRRILREPLLHFLLIGAALFGVYRVAGDRAGSENSSDRIIVTSAGIERLATRFARTWQRPPTLRELEGLVDEHIREEVLYREAQKFGLDRDDTIVRRRMRQKMEFLLSDVSEPAAPTDEELQAFLDENEARFVSEPQLSFLHVCFSRERRGARASADAREVLDELADGSASLEEALSRGDMLWWPSELPLTTMSEVSRQFGAEFTSQLPGIEPGRWAGPIETEYGFHLVRIDERIDAEIPELSKVHREVEREWTFLRQKELQETFYRELRDRYNVTIEWPGESREETAKGAVK